MDKSPLTNKPKTGFLVTGDPLLKGEAQACTINVANVVANIKQLVQEIDDKRALRADIHNEKRLLLQQIQDVHDKLCTFDCAVAQSDNISIIKPTSIR